MTNSTRFETYTSDTMFPHISFDTPLQENGKLVDYDSQKVYLLARESFADLKTYRFMSVEHLNLTTTYETVHISGYELNGMCQYNGKLDYFIGLHTETQELRVCNLQTYSNSTLAPLYCKTVSKNMEIEPQFIYSDCKHTGYIGTSRANTYIIAIGASGFDSAHQGQYNYFYAKFNTKYNLTESVVESDDPDVSERLVDVKVDLVHDQVYVVLDINSNNYKGVSIYEAGDELTEDNPNIAVLAYSFENAAITWVKIFGDLDYADYYIGMDTSKYKCIYCNDNKMWNI